MDKLVLAHANISWRIDTMSTRNAAWGTNPIQWPSLSVSTVFESQGEGAIELDLCLLALLDDLP